MNTMVLALVTILVSFAIGMIIAPMIVKFLSLKKSEQVILNYVKQHKGKEKTPTMGGLIFIIASAISTLAITGVNYKFALFALLIFLAYAIIGFLDDIIKVVFSRNKGLRAYQKILSQLFIAFIATYFAYYNEYIGSTINIPILHISFDIRWWYIPFSMFIYIAMTNGVNLTDGLDGLAGSTTFIYFVVFLVLTLTEYNKVVFEGNTFYGYELKSLSIFLASLIGGLLAFLWFNSYRAKIFMGDTGSLALGGACASVALFLQSPLLIVFVGIMYIVSCLSVMIQVVNFKIKRERIFLMSPFHHHLELKGLHEAKIVSLYSIITIIGGMVALILV